MGGFVLQELLQGIFHQALCQHLRCVVGGRLLPLATGKAVDKGAFLIHAQLALFLAGLIAHPFFLLILGKLRLRDKISHVQLIEVVPLALYLIEVMFRNESAIGQQGLIHGPHLVDAEVRIGNASPAAVLFAGGACQTHPVDDAQHTPVAELCLCNHPGIFRVEDMSLQGCNQEHVVQASGGGCCLQLFLRLGIAIINEVIELSQGLVQVITLAHFLHLISDVVGNVPQAFQGISGQIGLCLHGGIAKLRTCLNKEDK